MARHSLACERLSMRPEGHSIKVTAFEKIG
jgi:hypothetical protein